MAERLAARLNELAEEDLVRAHHGSLAREQRTEVEDALKEGHLRAIVATSSLELGIDMGAVDLVIQVESPGSVASGLQRIGRAGHQVGEPSRGKIFPKFRGDLLEAAVVTQRMRAGLIEETHYPRNPLDVLAQQLVAMCAVEEWHVDELRAVVRRVANFAELSDDVFAAVLDLLSGRYPSDDFAELRPRLVWDRKTGVVRAREGAGRLAITNAGTIPDRGLYGVFLPDGTRVGELDEEMVYESRRGEVFVLGASSWRIEDITRDRVVVVPAPGEPGKMPFWKGDKPGRPLELGRALGAFTRELATAPRADSLRKLRVDIGLDELAAENLVKYVDDQREATGAVPDDTTIVVERFRDELGDWRLCILSPFGQRVHAPWGLAIEARLTERVGPGAQVLWSDDGIVIRLPEAEDRIPLDDLLFDPDEVEEEVVRVLPGTALFASAFREASARALLLPRRRPGQRTALWQQRQRSADLLVAAAKHPTFPMLLETTRECLRDVFDVPALREVMADLRSRKTKLVAVDTERASPFAQSLLFRWVAIYMYEGDAPLAERRAAALALDRDLLRELLGEEELRDLLDPAALDELEMELQGLAEGRRRAQRRRRARPVGQRRRHDRGGARRTDGARSGRVDRAGARGGSRGARPRGGRSAPGGGRGRRRAPGCARRLPADRASRRVHRTHRTSAGNARGHDTPAPTLRSWPARRPRDSAPARIACAPRWMRWRRPGASPTVSSDREASSANGATSTCCGDCGGVRSPRSARRSSPSTRPRSGDSCRCGRASRCRRAVPTRLMDAIARLQGAAVPASILEHDVLRSRVRGFRPADLDAMCASGDLVWIGAGPLGADDGRVSLYVRDQVRLLAPPPPEDTAVERAPHGHPRSPRRPRRVVLAGPGPGRRNRRRARRPRGALGPGLGRRGHERHDGAAPGTHGEAFARDTQRPARGRGPARCDGPGRPPAPDAGRSSLRCGAVAEPDRGGPCASAATARSSRRAHARGGAVRGRAGRVRRRLRRAEGVGDVRARSGAGTSWTGSAPRSSPCRAPSIGSGRCASRSVERSARPCSWRRRTPPSRTVRRSRGPTGRVVPRVRRERSSCWSTGRSPRSWSAALGAC